MLRSTPYLLLCCVLFAGFLYLLWFPFLWLMLVMGLLPSLPLKPMPLSVSETNQQMPHNHKEISAWCLHEDKEECNQTQHDKASLHQRRRAPTRQTLGSKRGVVWSLRPAHSAEDPPLPPCNLFLTTRPGPGKIKARCLATLPCSEGILSLSLSLSLSHHRTFANLPAVNW